VTGNIALYIHIPFCRRKCLYCSFVSYVQREVDIPFYIQALKREILEYQGNDNISSIYFGGGTPSLLPPVYIGEIQDAVRQRFRMLTEAEISMEANPGTVDAAYLKAIRKLGVNRLSIGVQSLDDRDLKLLGRIHTAAQATEAFRLSRESGFDNINLDLIYGLPGQTLAAWQATLEKALNIAPEHFSLYALTLEPDVPLARLIDEEDLPVIDPDAVADQYELAEDVLDKAGYIHYEISNWAKPGYECQHNLVYWQNRPYLGVGVAAHSSLNGHRTANTGSLDEYLAAFSCGVPPPKELDEIISPALQEAETVILGLRLGRGIKMEEMTRCDGAYTRPVEEMTGLGLLEYSGGNIRLTRRGRLLSNEVFWRLLPE
jgi:oxygen-independent coproporphyrinogen-3 oxidase